MKNAPTRKPRVLLVSQTMDRGGLEQVVLTLARGIDRARFEVMAAYFVGGELADRLHVLPSLTAISLAGRPRWTRVPALWKVIRESRIDLVHNHFCWYGLAAAFLAGALRVETLHNTYRWFTPLQRAAYGMHLRLAHAVIAVSAEVRRFTQECLPLQRARDMHVIRNGIDVTEPAPGELDRLRRELSLPPGACVIGTVGRLEPEKGADLLIEAAASLAEDQPHLVWLVIGSGSEERRLRERAAGLRPGAVRFLGHRSDARSLLHLCDLFVLPSRYEGLPLALLEAMAAGCPVVAARAGGVPEAVEDGVQGLLVDPGDADDLREKISLLGGDPRRRSAMGAAGRKRARDLFSAERMVHETEEVYAAVLRGKGWGR